MDWMNMDDIITAAIKCSTKNSHSVALAREMETVCMEIYTQHVHVAWLRAVSLFEWKIKNVRSNIVAKAGKKSGENALRFVRHAKRLS